MLKHMMPVDIASAFGCSLGTLKSVCSTHGVSLSRPHAETSGTDWCTKDGAEKLAEIIRSFWAGYEVRVWIVQQDRNSMLRGHEGPPIWMVRSNIGFKMPRRKA